MPHWAMLKYIFNCDENTSKIYYSSSDEKRSCNDFFFRQHILCCLSKNKFSPFWVYSQWTKLNLFWPISLLSEINNNTFHSKKCRNDTLTTLRYFSCLCRLKSIKFFLYMKNNSNLHYYISAAYIYIPYQHELGGLKEM